MRASTILMSCSSCFTSTGDDCEVKFMDLVVIGRPVVVVGAKSVVCLLLDGDNGNDDDDVDTNEPVVVFR